MATSPVKRRIGYTLSYEAIAVVCSTVLLVVLGNDPLQSFPFAVISSLTAMVWNFLWNTFFEYLEKRRGWKGRSVPVRVFHAIGFEGGLSAILVPIMAWWLAIPLLDALFTEMGLLLFFLVYTYVFNFSFDKVFGLPESAQ